MQFCVWGYERYEELDKVYMKLVRRITRNMKNYPSKPIWALAVDGGLGIQSFLSNRLKLSLHINSTSRDPEWEFMPLWLVL